MLKDIIKSNLSDTSLKLSKYAKCRTKILAMNTFWVKENFSALISYYGVKYYCFWNKNLNDITVERC